MKILYFTVQRDNNERRSLLEIIQNVNSGFEGNNRNCDFYGNPIRLQEMHLSDEHQGLIIGDMVKIRLDDFPPKTKINGEQEDVELDDDEGFGESTAFIFDSNINVLIMQRNRTAVTESGFAKYFTEKGRTSSAILLNPILKDNALERIENLSEYRKFEITLSDTNSLSGQAKIGHTLSKMVDYSNIFNGQKVSIIVSMGHKRGSLTNIKTLARNLIELSSNCYGNVEKVQISGKEGSGDPIEIIDLLEFKVMDSKSIEIVRNYEESRKIRQNALLASYRDNKEALEERFRSL